MSLTLVVWCVILLVLMVKSLSRPSYAIGVYMLTFFAHPQFWWWGDPLEGYRWNFLAGTLLVGTLLISRAKLTTTGERPLSTNAAPILAFMVVNAVLVHALFAVNPVSSMEWLTARVKFIALFFLVQYAIKDEEDYNIVAMSITLGMAYIGYEATINERGSFSGGRLEGIGAAGVTSSNQLASLLVTGLPLAVTLLFTRIGNPLKALVMVGSGLTFNVVLMCNSRGAFLGLILGGFAFLLMASGPARKHSRRIIALAAVATFLLLGDPEILPRFLTTFTTEGQRDTSAQNRLEFWAAAREMIEDYPLGSGGNSFSEGRGWRYRSGTAGLPGDARTVRDTRAIHNGYLTEAADWGVQGFAIMVCFLAAIWKTLRRGRRLALSAGDASSVMVFASIAASLVAWMVSSVFGDYLNDEWGFWTAAVAYAYLRVRMFAPATGDAARAAATVSPQGSAWSPAMPQGVAR